MLEVSMDAVFVVVVLFVFALILLVARGLERL